MAMRRTQTEAPLSQGGLQVATMDVEAAATYLGIAKRTLAKNHSKKGYPTAKRIGKRVLFMRRDLDAFLNEA